ncbi:FAD-binding oxidoreductase [Hoyosella subflava]|uniref:Putative D-lactate dehydrogenase (Cytochrome) n=1 Tax=Hoyosella subflava (strain DSM 45089 / JCM 17490 / NBRC 109087 / DQS3-9A1) TaxID=443218 RepID=F6EQB4_HOYSD|nr:FAD-linked oxidase C-terminal domain-containing protein [Hoyosella subflava]AEF40599.1 putative D-lactate dehydrogenase (Cytochrome) [Hoyosella subflava DQS3-9A1]
MSQAAAGTVRELTASLGGVVVTDPVLSVGYRRDHSHLTTFGTPAAVVRARDVSDVVATLQAAHRYSVPVVTRGAGTGLAGGANAVDGCIILSLERMNRILEIDEYGRTASVEAGVINGDLASAATACGLWYVPDPGSRDISTIGGNLATNAGGACCAKYGVTADHVARIKAVLPDGQMIHTGASTRKNSAGLNLTQLLVGSEGTLAVIVEATLRLRRKPEGVTTLVASFRDSADAVCAVMRMQSVADPCLAELMDRTTIAAVNRMTKMGLDESAGALLLVQCDGAGATEEVKCCAQACSDSHATELYVTSDAEEGEALMRARRVALTALEQLGSTLLDDLVVPVPQLTHMLEAIAHVANRHNLLIGTFGHAADGNLHPTIVFDPRDEEMVLRAHNAFDEMVAHCLQLGGSITGEHGVGLLKRRYLTQMVGAAEHQLMTGIKSVFDPRGILNPGRSL